MGVIKISNLYKKYKELNVLENISITVQEGEFIAIVGPSGCGKSTLLKLIAGFEKPTTGDLEVFGHSVVGPNKQCMLVFQEHTLYPWRSVAENIALGPEIQRWAKSKRAKKVQDMLVAVGLEDFADYYPHQISGGMCQRASLARAFIMEPNILLLDEPFGALDALTRLELQEQLLRLWEGTKRSVVLITHDVEEAVFLADRILVMGSLQGRVIKEYHVDLARVRNRSGARFTELKEEILNSLIG